MSAINQFPSLFSDRGLNLTLGISVDGSLLDKALKAAFRDSEFNSVPLMVGSTDDEGREYQGTRLNLATPTHRIFFLQDLLRPRGPGGQR